MESQRSLVDMTHSLSHRAQRLLAVMTALAVGIGLMIFAVPGAEAATRKQQRQYAQALVAHEKLSLDVISDMANWHQDGIFFLMSRAEERDLARARSILKANGWRDLTAGDRWGQFSRFPLVEQAYYDMVFNGETSSADGARVGLALQQRSIALANELLGSGMSRADRTLLRETKQSAFNNWIAYRAHINRVG
jgi:hypothetical protein